MPSENHPNAPAIEDCLTAKEASPLDAQACDFPWEEVYHRLDGEAPEADDRTIDQTGQVADALTRGLLWLVRPGETMNAEQVGKRALALSRALDGGQPDAEVKGR